VSPSIDICIRQYIAPDVVIRDTRLLGIMRSKQNEVPFTERIPLMTLIQKPSDECPYDNAFTILSRNGYQHQSRKQLHVCVML
jgi:hypothetical protein